SDAVAADFNALAAFIGPLAGIANLTAGPSVAKPKQPGPIVRPEFEAYVSLEGLIDPVAEAKRLEKQIADAKKQVAGRIAKLSNESYIKNAPPEVVAETRAKVVELEKQIATMEENLKDLQAK